MTVKKEAYDDIRGYCRMLGHEVPFSYCRIAKEGVPCFKILDCWFERIKIRQYMETLYTKEELDRILARPQPKVATLFDLIEQAKKRAKKE